MRSIYRSWTNEFRKGGAAESALKLRLGLWLLLTAALSPLLYRASLEAAAGAFLSPLAVVEQGGVHSWGVLVLCLVWLWVKRRAIRAGMDDGPSLRYVALGLAYLGASLILFPPGALLMGGLGLFAIMFGRGSLIPSLLLGIYIFAAAFPKVVSEVAAGPYAATALVPVAFVLKGLGYPLVTEGALLKLSTASGEFIRVIVNEGCAGPATMGMFIALFALMTLDMPLPWRAALPLLILGVMGTWLQSVARILLLLLLGYYQGEPALWEAHGIIGYILFSMWYLLFAYLYFKQAGRLGWTPSYQHGKLELR